MALFFEAVRPALIQLQTVNWNISQRALHESFAAIARCLEQIEHGAFFDIAKPRC